MKKLILITLAAFLTGCQTTQNQSVSSLASDDFDRSSCSHCKLKPFYVDGHWVEGRD